MDILSLYVASFCLPLLLLPASVTPAPLYDEPALPVAVLPTRTDGKGEHLSFDLLPPEEGGEDVRHYFRIDTFGKSFRLNVSESTQRVLSPEHTVEYHHSLHGVRRGNRSSSNECRHFTGVVREESKEGVVLDEEGWAAISYCRGLRGVIATSTSGYLYIEPKGVAGQHSDTLPHPHLLRSSPHLPPGRTCSHEKTSSSENRENLPHGDKVRVRRSRDSTSLSSEHWVEVAMVADHTMLEYHGAREVEAYLFTLMNMVAHIYRDPSIGHAVNIVVVRTIILETQQSDLSISTDALTSLASFCSWQSSHLPSSSSSSSPGQPDVSILVTRANICEGFGASCSTLGIAEFKGACSPEKSCSISEDIGLATAFTIAHELGHSLGIRHDGDMSVVCEPNDHFIMAPTFAQSRNPHIWSHCSRQQLAEFLLSPESSCLSNEPDTTGGNSSLPLSLLGRVPLPGLETTPTEQCQLMLGDTASHCGISNSSDFCSHLKCRADNSSECVHRHIPPASGTSCILTTAAGSGGREGVCYQGVCVEFASLAEPVDGGWGEWGAWEPCSLSCGTGVQGSSRLCDSPLPANGGRYCLGASHHHQTCSSAPCPTHSDIRQELCDSEPPHSIYTQWEAPSLEYILKRQLDQCSHHCLSKPNNILFSLTMDLPDGTPCVYTAHPSLPLEAAPVPESLGLCVSGECTPIDCNNSLHGMASRDPCGAWCGNGSTCVPVSDTFTIPELTANRDTSDYIYHRAVTIPQGSGQVKISELRHTDNLYLAATTPTENFNGNYRVKEGDLDSYWFAGAKWWYERPDTGIECLRTAGVVKEDVTIFIITNSRNLSIQYSAGVPLGNASIFEVDHEWVEGEWGRCEGVCGEGVKRRGVECAVSDTRIVVRDELCDFSSKPLAEEPCFTDEGCQYEWRVSPWSDCNTTCGVGERTRTLHCNLTNNQSVVQDSYCENQAPLVVKIECRSDEGCVYQWEAGEWGDCSSPCGEGARERDITCLLVNSHTAVSSERCAGTLQPHSSSQCYSERGCVFTWELGEWGVCSSTCGGGHRERVVSCVLASNDTIVSSTYCEGNSTSPSHSAPCYSEEGCSFEWISGDWSECSTQCGTGSRSREIACVITNNATTVEEVRCDTATRPNPSSQCYRESGCEFVWNTTVWSECDTTCGWGERQRNAVCVLTNNDTEVDERFCRHSRPDTRSRCHSREGCVYSWWNGNWTSCSSDCGRGTISRDIACYLTNNNTRVDPAHCPRNSQPPQVAGCHDNSGCVYTWVSEPWSECSNGCGNGTSTRSVTCLLLNNKTTVSDELCATDSKPREEQNCYSERECVFVWQNSEWGNCSAVCGGGQRERDVSCLLTNNDSMVDAAFCSLNVGVPPASVSVCGEDDCQFQWTAGEWGECVYDDPATSPCEEGRRGRRVWCTLVNNRSVVEERWCNEEDKPVESSQCSVDGCGYEWVEGEWGRCDTGCGEGVRERQVHCEQQQQSGGGRRVEDGRCEAEKPRTTEACWAEPCVNFDWVKGDWTTCDAECGEDGHQSRVVSCRHKNGTLVSESPYCTLGKQRPEERRGCSGEPCETCVDRARTSCTIIVRIRLCHVPRLRDLCCASCVGL